MNSKNQKIIDQKNPGIIEQIEYEDQNRGDDTSQQVLEIIIDKISQEFLVGKDFEVIKKFKVLIKSQSGENANMRLSDPNFLNFLSDLKTESAGLTKNTKSQSQIFEDDTKFKSKEVQENDEIFLENEDDLVACNHTVRNHLQKFTDIFTKNQNCIFPSSN